MNLIYGNAVRYKAAMDLILHIKGNFSDATANTRLQALAQFFTQKGMTRQKIGQDGFIGRISMHAERMEEAVDVLKGHFERENGKKAKDLTFTPSIEKADGRVTFVVDAAPV